MGSLTASCLIVLTMAVMLSLAEDELVVLRQPSRDQRILLIRTGSAEPCQVYENRNSYLIQLARQRRSSPVRRSQYVQPRIRLVDKAEWNRLAAECQYRVDVRVAQNPVKSPERQFDLVYPGTKWCGPGSLAGHYDELGPHSFTDECCREHDHCQDTMAAGTCKHGLCNTTPFSLSHCDCDERFRKCLMQANDPAATSVGFMFFDIGFVGCFRKSPSCPAKSSGVPGRKRRRRQFQYRNDVSLNQSNWCFFDPKPFKKPALEQSVRRTGQSLGHVLFGHVLSTVADLKSAALEAALSGLGKI